jgi:hypothetical protein
VADYWGGEGKVDSQGLPVWRTVYTQNGVQGPNFWDGLVGLYRGAGAFDGEGLPLAPDAPRAEVTGEGVSSLLGGIAGVAGAGRHNTFILQTNGQGDYRMIILTVQITELEDNPSNPQTWYAASQGLFVYPVTRDPHPPLEGCGPEEPW